jgi:hypothetical protein
MGLHARIQGESKVGGMLLVLSNRWMQQQPPASMGRFNAVPNAAATSRISKRLPRGGNRLRELELRVSNGTRFLAMASDKRPLAKALPIAPKRTPPPQVKESKIRQLSGDQACAGSRSLCERIYGRPRVGLPRTCLVIVKRL